LGYSRNYHKPQQWLGSGEKQPPLERLSPRVLPLRGGFLNVEVKKKSGGAWF
jgi:hypothetical protein